MRLEKQAVEMGATMEQTSGQFNFYVKLLKLKKGIDFDDLYESDQEAILDLDMKEMSRQIKSLMALPTLPEPASPKQVKMLLVLMKAKKGVTWTWEEAASKSKSEAWHLTQALCRMPDLTFYSPPQALGTQIKANPGGDRPTGLGPEDW